MLPSKLADNGVHDGYTSVNLVHRGIQLTAATGYDIQLPEGVYTVALSTLEPGGFLLPHRDKGPWMVRTQIPVEPAGWYWDSLQGALHMGEVGVEYPVNHHVAHAVWNDTDQPRIHLIVDRLPVHGSGPFETYPTESCPELKEWLDGSD